MIVSSYASASFTLSLNLTLTAPAPWFTALTNVTVVSGSVKSNSALFPTRSSSSSLTRVAVNVYTPEASGVNVSVCSVVSFEDLADVTFPSSSVMATTTLSAPS